MTRFKEARRIEHAIRHDDKVDLAWAHEYATTRLKTAKMKHHEKYWRKMLKRVEEAMGGE